VRIILLADVDNVGLRGDLVDVAPGFARNYLLPRRLAENATAGRVADVRRRDEQRARQEARTHEQAEQIADTLTKTVLRFEVNAGPTGALFGSVTATNIVDELWRTRRIRVDRRKVDLAEPIKRIGRYEIPIDVFEDVRVEVKTLVVPEGGELPPEDETPAAVEPEASAEPAATVDTGALESAATADAVEAGAVEAEAAAAEAEQPESEPGPEAEPEAAAEPPAE